MRNIYDEGSFFEAYSNMPRSREGLPAAGEWHQLQAMFPDVKGKRMLDLGCGYGWHCRYAVQMGASHVLGIDGSQRMIAKAKAENADERIEYRVCRLEEYAYPEDAFDFVFSNLVLHYIRDLESIYQKICRTLKKGGCFLFNIEHPVFTAGIREDWIYDTSGKPLYWAIDDYYYPGERETDFLGQKVIKQHHTLTQIIDPLIQAGFCLEGLREAMPPEHMMHQPGMEGEMRRPMMLLVKAMKR